MTPIGLTIAVPMILQDDVFLKHVGCYLSLTCRVKNEDRIFFLLNQDVVVDAHVTGIEQPGQESKFGGLTAEQTQKCYKIHWTSGPRSLNVPIPSKTLPLRAYSVHLDEEDVKRVLDKEWNTIKTNKGNKSACYLYTRIEGKTVTLGRFLLRQNKPVYQVNKGPDFRKINLRIRHPRCKESSFSPT